jgi:hypothetical protein
MTGGCRNFGDLIIAGLSSQQKVPDFIEFARVRHPD